MNGQTPIGDPTVPAGTRLGEISDTLFVAVESDHIFPGIQGGAGSFDWLHTPNQQMSFVLGGSFEKLAQTHWSLFHGGMVLFHDRWTIETSARAGRGNATTGGFGYQDYFGALTYHASTHLFSTVKEEYIGIGSAHGNLLRASVCACGLGRFSTTFSGAHSVGGNLATEFLSLSEDIAGRKYDPFIELTAGRILPRLTNSALDSYSNSAATVSVSGGSRIQISERNSLKASASFVQTGQSRMLTLALSIGIKLRGD